MTTSNPEAEQPAAPTGSTNKWRSWRTQSRDDVEMLGDGWARTLLQVFGMVLWTGVVLWGIASGAVGVLMQARKQQSKKEV
jgi:hypothetical protein